MRLSLPKLIGPKVPTGLETIIERLAAGLLAVYQTRAEFVSAASGAQSRYLPDGMRVPEQVFVFVKTDATANAVTIYPFGTQLIDAAASVALAARGDSVKLIFDTANQTWWSV